MEKTEKTEKTEHANHSNEHGNDHVSPMSWLTETVKSSIVKLVKNADEVTREVVTTIHDRVREITHNSLQLVTQMGDATSNAARSAVRAADEAGGDAIKVAVKLLTGTFDGTAETTMGAVKALRSVASGVIQGLVDVGVDLEKAAMQFLTDYRNGTLGRISLETPETRRAMLEAAAAQGAE